jgi:hypothetical protein
MTRLTQLNHHFTTKHTEQLTISIKHTIQLLSIMIIKQVTCVFYFNSFEYNIIMCILRKYFM